MASTVFKIAVLTWLHFTADFLGGLTLPLPEPTLVQHFNTDLFTVMWVITASALLCNLIQPIAGSLLPKNGLPVLLVICPLLAGLAACIGLTDRIPLFAIMLLLSFTAIGLIHPEAALTVQAIAPRRKSLAVASFMSGGFLGYSTGALAGAWWAKRFLLENFWIFCLPAVLAATLVVVAGLHRAQGHVKNADTDRPGGLLPFKIVLAVSIAISIAACLLVRMYPVYAYRAFGPRGQEYSGVVLFSLGIAGALASYLWGHIADRHGCGRTIALVELAGIPFYFLLLFVPGISLAPLWAIGIGMTAGAVFPLTVVMAQNAGGLKPRLRMGLCIGGAWAVGEVVVMLAAKYMSLCPPGAVEPARNVLLIPPVASAVAALLSYGISRREGSISTMAQLKTSEMPDRIPEP